MYVKDMAVRTCEMLGALSIFILLFVVFIMFMFCMAFVPYIFMVSCLYYGIKYIVTGKAEWEENND